MTDINRDFLKQIMTADITKGSYPSPFDSSVDVCGFLHSLIHSLENHSLTHLRIILLKITHSLENHSFTHLRITLLKIIHSRITHPIGRPREDPPNVPLPKVLSPRRYVIDPLDRPRRAEEGQYHHHLQRLRHQRMVSSYPSCQSLESQAGLGRIV